MKQVIYKLILLLLLAACSSKNKEPEKAICVSALVDLTDQRQLYPNADGILPLFNFNNDENNKAQFRLGTITDRELYLYLLNIFSHILIKIILYTSALFS